MKKKLTQAQQDVLALTVVQGQYGMTSSVLAELGALVVGGYVEGNEIQSVRATTKGVRIAVRDGLVIQEGTRFRLPDGSALVLQPPPHGTPLPALRLIPLPKPRDPFDEGFTAARAGQPANNTWTDLNDASMYDEGFKQGDLWTQQHPVVSA